MMSSRPNVPLERYKYDIDDLIINASEFEEPINVRHDFVKSISIVNDYENTISPRIQLVFQVEKEYYKSIALNMNTLTVTFNIYKIFVGELLESKDLSTDEVEQRHVWKRLSFKAINSDNLSTSDINNLLKDEEFIDVDNTADNTQKTVIFTLLLYDNIKINKYHKNNYFIMDGGKNDMLYNFLKDRGFNNVLMSPTDNIYDKYIIPYGHLGNNLTSLNNYYGIYKTPYLFYMDMDYTYLIEKGTVGSTLRKDELSTVAIYLEKKTSEKYVDTGSYIDIDNNMHILNTRNFDISDNDSSIDYAIGGNIKTVISGTGEVKNDKIGDYDVERSIIVDNNLQHSQLIFNINEQKRNVVLTFSNIDLGIITPNKLYTIFPDDAFYDSKYNIKGNYRLSKSLILLTSTNDNEFNSSIQITLNKIFGS